MELDKRMNFILEAFRSAPRFALPKDEPEGVRDVQISETLVNEMINIIGDVVEYRRAFLKGAE